MNLVDVAEDRGCADCPWIWKGDCCCCLICWLAASMSYTCTVIFWGRYLWELFLGFSPFISPVSLRDFDLWIMVWISSPIIFAFSTSFPDLPSLNLSRYSFRFSIAYFFCHRLFLILVNVGPCSFLTIHILAYFWITSTILDLSIINLLILEYVQYPLRHFCTYTAAWVFSWRSLSSFNLLRNKYFLRDFWTL